MTFQPFTIIVDKTKVKEFAMAIGDLNPVYIDGQEVPPTFATALDMWGGLDFGAMANKLGFRLEKLLHGEQEYIYYSPLIAGQTVTVHTALIEQYIKADMTFAKLEMTYLNETGEKLLIGRTTLIERN